MDCFIGTTLILSGILLYILTKNKANFESNQNDGSLFSKSQNVIGFFGGVFLIILGILSFF